MPTLYSMHLSRHVDGFGKPSVPAVIAPALSGHYGEDERDIVQPDRAAIREALPHYYRKAFDRAGSFWFPKDTITFDRSVSPWVSKGSKAAAYVALYSTRGRWLNTVYAIPYSFNP